MPKFTLDPCVEDELWGIWHFIAQDNPHAATRVIEAACDTFKMLAANPGLGTLCDPVQLPLASPPHLP
jgi:plasmid stabilization system protein ParE